MASQPPAPRRWPMCGPPTETARQHHGWRRAADPQGPPDPDTATTDPAEPDADLRAVSPVSRDSPDPITRGRARVGRGGSDAD
jgi:hypothetical protein